MGVAQWVELETSVWDEFPKIKDRLIRIIFLFMLDQGISSLHASMPSPVSFFSSLQIWDILIKDVTQMETKLL